MSIPDLFTVKLMTAAEENAKSYKFDSYYSFRKL